MLMVGLESMDSTLAGVRALLERGCVPVLSPFVPDTVTPMADSRPPTAEYTLEVFFRATELAEEYGAYLGPDCVPCMHNTMTLPGYGAHAASTYPHNHPVLASGV